MPESITSLIEKLEAVSEGSRELDAAIADLLLDPIFKPLSKTRQMRWPFVEGSGIAAMTPTVTTSLDAALALAERALDHMQALSLLHAVIDLVGGHGFTSSRIAPLFCAAILRAQSEGRV